MLYSDYDTDLYTMLELTSTDCQFGQEQQLEMHLKQVTLQARQKEAVKTEGAGGVRKPHKGGALAIAGNMVVSCRWRYFGGHNNSRNTSGIPD